MPDHDPSVSGAQSLPGAPVRRKSGYIEKTAPLRRGPPPAPGCPPLRLSPGDRAVIWPAVPSGQPAQFVEKPAQKKIRLSRGGGARGGSRPPRMGSNAPEALLCKASGKRSEDFCAARRRKSNGIFAGCPIGTAGFLRQNSGEGTGGPLRVNQSSGNWIVKRNTIGERRPPRRARGSAETGGPLDSDPDLLLQAPADGLGNAVAAVVRRDVTSQFLHRRLRVAHGDRGPYHLQHG